MSDNFKEIRNLIDNFDVERARYLLRDKLKDKPSAEAYYLASLVALDKVQQKKFLQQALDIDPFHDDANQELARLELVNQPAKNAEKSLADSSIEGKLEFNFDSPTQEILQTIEEIGDNQPAPEDTSSSKGTDIKGVEGKAPKISYYKVDRWFWILLGLPLIFYFVANHNDTRFEAILDLRRDLVDQCKLIYSDPVDRQICSGKASKSDEYINYTRKLETYSDRSAFWHILLMFSLCIYPVVGLGIISLYLKGEKVQFIFK